MLKIGDFSKLAQVSVKTLRYYAELGLLRPAWVDRYTGYRYYTLQQIPRLNRILALKDLGFSLVEIEQMLRDDLPAGELQRLMRLRQAQLQQQVQAEQARLARIAARLSQIEQEGRLPGYEVLVKRAEPRLVAGIRDSVSGYAGIGELLAELRDYLRGRNAAAPAGAPALAIYYDAEYRDAGADVEVAVPVDRPVKSSARVAVHALPGIERAASVVHAGSYETLPGAYRTLVTWTQANGYRTAGPNREVYLQGPGSGLGSRDYVTELQFPIQAASVRSTTQSQEGQTMEPRIITKPAFTVVGLPFAGLITNSPYENGQDNNEIGAVWDEFNRRYSEIRHISGPAIGLCYGMPSTTEAWYIAGSEVSHVDDVPAGMVSMAVPAQKYAVFGCTLGTLGATYHYISEEWQARSGFERGDGPDFELYDETFDPNAPQHSQMYVYWPIK